MLRRRRPGTRRRSDAEPAAGQGPERTDDPHELALRLLAQRARTARELRDTLLERGVARDACEAEIERLAAAGLLDDAAVASAHVRRRLRGLPRAPRAILRELAERGVPPETARAAIGAETGDEPEQALIHRVLDGLRPRGEGDAADGRRLAAALARRGFRPALIAEALRERGISWGACGLARTGGLRRRR